MIEVTVSERQKQLEEQENYTFNRETEVPRVAPIFVIAGLRKMLQWCTFYGSEKVELKISIRVFSWELCPLHVSGSERNFEDSLAV